MFRVDRRVGRFAGASGALIVAATLMGSLLLAACGSSESLQTTPSPTPTSGEPAVSEAGASDGPAPRGKEVPRGADGYLQFQQGWIEGLSSTELDTEDVDEVFWHVFSRLPDEIIVYPTENYYYFTLQVAGRRFNGNIRLPAATRDDGVLSFNYFEFREFPGGGRNPSGQTKYYNRDDGVGVTKIDRFTYEVAYRDRFVTFHLNQISQEPPKLFPLGEDEVFVERTFDESGYRFFLLFNEKGSYPFWILNEEDGVPDVLESFGKDLVVGKRSAFAFWVDRTHGDRKVLVGIWRFHANRNDYFDGPFDQLADNYAEEVGISEYIQRAYPGLRGQIDKYGIYTDRVGSRVALSTYMFYDHYADVRRFMVDAVASDDPYRYISEDWKRRNRPPDTTPSP